jgi:acyl carrier protein
MLPLGPEKTALCWSWQRVFRVKLATMTPQDEQKLQRVFHAIFKLAPGTDLSGVRPNQTPQWDSLGHVTLVAALESEFNVNLDMADALRITSLDVAREVLEQHGV